MSKNSIGNKALKLCVNLINITHLTIVSIFFLYFGSILHRYSGLINIAAKLKAEFFNPAR